MNEKLQRYIRRLIYETLSEVDVNESQMINKLRVISLDKFVGGDVGGDEIGESLLGANVRVVGSGEMEDYLGKTVSGRKTKADKYVMPYIHRSNVPIRDEADRLFDLNKLKSAIMQRPGKILKQNQKIVHSGGSSSIYFNIGLPALKGLAVNESTGEFVVVDTCPGAGACKVYCYAKKGGYVQWKASSMSQTRLLNFLLNDTEGFKSKLMSEIQDAISKYDNRGIKVVIRWHDAGDFFSPDYVDLAYSVARKFPQVDFYAYTKMASVVLGNKPDNFIINFSMGATIDQEKQIQPNKVKHSTVIPSAMFDDLILKDDSGKLVRDDEGKMQFKSQSDIDVLKKRLSTKYNVSMDSIITYGEMKDIPAGTTPYYNVIVKPGDGDESANRADVIATWLLIH